MRMRNSLVAAGSLFGCIIAMVAGCYDPYNDVYLPLTDAKLATTGTGGSSTTTGTGGTGGDGGGGSLNCSGEPSVTNTVEECAVFVRADAADAKGDGTRAKPYKTLQAAIDKAGDKRVAACTNVACAETVTIAKGVELFGGYDCLKGWTWKATSRRTRAF